MKIEIVDHHDAILLLEKAVASRGEDHIYKKSTSHVIDVLEAAEACYYVDPTDLTNRCIVGQAVTDAGYAQPEELAESCVNNQSAGSEGFVGYLKEHGYSLTPEAQEILLTAQQIQDSGSSWGQALRTATETYTDICFQKALDDASE